MSGLKFTFPKGTDTEMLRYLSTTSTPLSEVIKGLKKWPGVKVEEITDSDTEEIKE